MARPFLVRGRTEGKKGQPSVSHSHRLDGASPRKAVDSQNGFVRPAARVVAPQIWRGEMITPEDRRSHDSFRIRRRGVLEQIGQSRTDKVGDHKEGVRTLREQWKP